MNASDRAARHRSGGMQRDVADGVRRCSNGASLSLWRRYHLARGSSFRARYGCLRICGRLAQPNDVVLRKPFRIITYRASKPKNQDIYARVGVAEFWRYSEAAGLEAFGLVEEAYVLITTSGVIPGLPVREIGIRVTEDTNRWRNCTHGGSGCGQTERDKLLP